MKLESARTIIATAFEVATGAGSKPLAAIVLDAGGHPVVFERQDGASFFRLEIARAKATGALGMGTDTRGLAEGAKRNPAFFSSLSAVVEGRVVFSPGGCLVRDADGAIVGAVGISGDTGDMDEECGMAGIRAAGFATSQD